MIEAFQDLLRMQELDGAIRAAEQELASFGPQREQAALAADADQAAIADSAAALREVEHEHRRLELELAEADALVAKLDLQLYEVTSKHAMEAMQKEIAAAREHKSRLEDAILELLDAIEAAADAVQIAESRARDESEARAAAESVRTAREREQLAELESLRARRAALAGQVDAVAIQGYEAARRKAWPVLVHVETRSCPACHIVIAPQKWLDITAAGSLVNCGSCHRILYGEKVAAATTPA